MKNIKKTIAIGIVAVALLVLGHTIYGSVFYAENNGASVVDVNDGGATNNLATVIEASTTVSTGNVVGGQTRPRATSTTPTTVTAATNTLPPKLPVATTTPVTNPSSLPTRLIIPSLSIDANVQYVTINAKGNMGTPNNFTDVSWYKPGTVPGQLGSAVMAGHVDNGLSLAGVFKHLDTIQVGADVYVKQASGAQLHFIVERVVHYPYTAVPAQEVFNTHDAKRLNLITCVGAWVPGQKTYDERLVVYTRLVE